jgi:hypothetical protein
MSRAAEIKVASTLRTAWRACPVGLVGLAVVAGICVALAAVGAWNLAAGRVALGVLYVVALAVVARLLLRVLRVWASTPVALRAELRAAIKAMKGNQGLWAARAPLGRLINREPPEFGPEDVLLTPDFSHADCVLWVMAAEAFWEAIDRGGTYTAAVFLLYGRNPRVFRYVTGNRINPGQPATMPDLPGTRREQAREMRKAAAEGRMDATPEEIETVLRQIRDARPIPGTKPPRDA